jgi:thiol-disulfide isomerase/thioredoxin
MDSAVKRYIIPVLTVIMIAAAAYYHWANSQKTEENFQFGVTTGHRVKDVTLFGLDSKPIMFSDYHGGIIIIDFMAPWCNPCIEQVKVLRELNGAPGVTIISINVDSSYNATYLTKFKEREGIEWTLANSPETAQEYKVTAIPLIIFVDKGGIIRYRGYYTTMIQFEQLIKSYG